MSKEPATSTTEALKGLPPDRQKLFKALEATREVFKDLPAEEIECEVARAIAEDRTERRARRAKETQAPRST